MVQKERLTQMDQLEDLLPGIEEFLSSILSKETLSQYAEEQRLYFLERLDIIKLPPSIPPRPQSLGIRLYPLHSSPPPARNSDIPSLDQDDFAAYQRELSRALVDSETSPEPAEVKVYDDIDLSDISFVHEHSTVQTEEESVYEIPQIKTRNLSDSGYERAKNRTFSDSGYEKAIDISAHVVRAVSLEALDVLHSPIHPPPLPPRRDRAISDAASRSSIGSILEDKMLEFSQKMGNESSDDILDEAADDLDGCSYDSMDDTGSLTQLSDVQLPKPTKKRRRSQRRKMVQSLSSMKEVAVPLRNLEDVLLTGELHYRSKLTWTRKIVALTNGRMICYKPEKAENRPSFVILLTGYKATFQKREGKRNFEIILAHDNFESHVFLADFKEWAEIWCEYIKYSAQGKKPPGPVLNLTRGSSMLFDCPDGTYQLGKSPMGSSGSNVSLASSDGFDTDPGTVKVKKRDSTGLKTARMGSFAFKATQFFESLGKKSSVKKTLSSGSEKARPLSATLSQSSLTEEAVTPLTPESGIMLESPLEVKRHIKHQGYLDVYSSFNKRKWGKRWCMVHENNFECYRTQTSEVCELEFMLHDCELRRAIEETKSELGLMLLENKREKITIEPVNWNEFGSWLRVLMGETCTPEVPDGLAAYMDDTNPYHEAVEVTRLSMLSDPFPKSPTSPGASIPSFEEITVNNSNNQQQLSAKNKNQRNRDSGNCSSESVDGKFESLERHQRHRTHTGYNDSSLPRVTMPDSGDIYTQIRKRSVSSAKNKSSSMDDQSSSRSKSEGREPVGASGAGNQMFEFNFESDTLNVSDQETGGSLMDEIMSQFRSQIPSTIEDEDVEDTINSNEVQRTPLTSFSDTSDAKNISGNQVVHKNPSETVHNQARDKVPSADSANSNDRNTIEGLTQMTAAVTRGSDFNVLNVEAEIHRHDSPDALDDTEIEIRHKLGVDSTVRKTSSLLYGEKGMTEVIEELRTRLVQLKNDRISIRDRKQKVTSDIGREYLEAEFNRLNRECDKVAEEIKYLEKLQKLEKIVSSKEASILKSTGASSDQVNVKLKHNREQHSDQGGYHKDKISVDQKGGGNDVDDEEITVEMLSNVCDSIVVPKVKQTASMFATVQESIVSNDDLVHKPNIVDADVILVEPDIELVDGNDKHRCESAEDIAVDVKHNAIVELFKDKINTESESTGQGQTHAIVNEQINTSNVIGTDSTDTNGASYERNLKTKQLPSESIGVTGESSFEIDALISDNSKQTETQEGLSCEATTTELTTSTVTDKVSGANDLRHSETADSCKEYCAVDDGNTRSIVVDQRPEELTNETVETKEDTSDGENGVIRDLADEFEKKLRLES